MVVLPGLPEHIWASVAKGMRGQAEKFLSEAASIS